MSWYGNVPSLFSTVRSLAFLGPVSEIIWSSEDFKSNEKTVPTFHHRKKTCFKSVILAEVLSKYPETCNTLQQGNETLFTLYCIQHKCQFNWAVKICQPINITCEFACNSVHLRFYCVIFMCIGKLFIFTRLLFCDTRGDVKSNWRQWIRGTCRIFWKSLWH